MNEQQRSNEHPAEISSDLLEETSTTIATRLGEISQTPCRQIRRAVKVLGTEAALAFLHETMEIEAGEGMMLRDGSRRRTPGGVFFSLLRTKTEKQVRKRIFPPTPKKAVMASPPTPGAGATLPRSGPSALQQPVFTWEDRIATLEEIGAEKGQASTVKITLIGTLGKYVDKGTCIVGMMQSGDKIPSLPKGVPAPAPAKTNYVVYIATKQWKNVAATVSDPQDALIIEGFPQIDTKTGAISVFASTVTSKKLQAAKRQQG
jgi:hypothetical protein